MRAAAYARYSSDAQRDASIDDQLRNIRAYCQRQGWPAPAEYIDAAISGSRSDRPQYQRMLTAAEARAHDIIIVDDISRLSRDQIESARAVRMLTHWGIRLIGVSDGIDTARKGHKLEVGLRGIMSEAYLDDLAEKTHRGLTGQALQGRSAGGMPYGYRSTDTPDGHGRAIIPAQAAIVRRIYQLYADGNAARAIAAQLNAEATPAPRGGTWTVSAIYGDTKRGIGILANPMYTGRWIWNRSTWVKDPITGRRTRRERPESEWIITDHPDLRIVPDALWQAVEARRRAVNYNTRRAQAKHGPRARAGSGPRYLFSGLLTCGTCGGSIVIVDRYRYGCSTHKDRGPSVCNNSRKVPRTVIEARLLAGIKAELLSEPAYRQFEAAARAAIKAAQPDQSTARQRLQQAERERENILHAIRQGIITHSTKAALQAAEAQASAAQAELHAMQQHQPEQMLPRAREIWKRMVNSLADIEDIASAREALRELLGHITISPREAGWIAELQNGLSAASKINVVAGAGYVTHLTPTIRIPLYTTPSTAAQQAATNQGPQIVVARARKAKR